MEEKQLNLTATEICKLGNIMKKDEIKELCEIYGYDSELVIRIIDEVNDARRVQGISYELRKMKVEGIKLLKFLRKARGESIVLSGVLNNPSAEDLKGISMECVVSSEYLADYIESCVAGIFYNAMFNIEGLQGYFEDKLLGVEVPMKNPVVKDGDFYIYPKLGITEREIEVIQRIIEFPATIHIQSRKMKCELAYDMMDRFNAGVFGENESMTKKRCFVYDLMSMGGICEENYKGVFSGGGGMAKCKSDHVRDWVKAYIKDNDVLFENNKRSFAGWCRKYEKEWLNKESFKAHVEGTVRSVKSEEGVAEE